MHPHAAQAPGRRCGAATLHRDGAQARLSLHRRGAGDEVAIACARARSGNRAACRRGRHRRRTCRPDRRDNLWTCRRLQRDRPGRGRRIDPAGRHVRYDRRGGDWRGRRELGNRRSIPLPWRNSFAYRRGRCDRRPARRPHRQADHDRLVPNPLRAVAGRHHRRARGPDPRRRSRPRGFGEPVDVGAPRRRTGSGLRCRGQA